MAWELDRSGNHVALDFVNTVGSRHTVAPIERLGSYEELVSCARQLEIIDAARARRLLAAARRDPDRARQALERAVSLREALYRLFAAIATGEEPARADRARLDAELPRLCIGPDLGWSWRDEDRSLDSFLGAVVKAAVELVTSAEARDRVRVCGAPDCLWLFYDSSKNRSRRWCDMRQCGNRMKARRHYQRHHGHEED